MATSHGPVWTARELADLHVEDSTGHPTPPSDEAMAPAYVDLESSADAPEPNPHFVFPMKPTSPQSTPSTAPRASRRRPKSTIEHPNLSIDGLTANAHQRSGSVALPAFSFNPGASLPPDPHALLSPPVTPNSPRGIPSPSRPAGHGHRRGGSEFVGGRIREGNSIAVMSTSPTKSESGFASPTLQPPRRGHRRGISSTISTNDLPILFPPPHIPTLKSGSAPNSPTNFDRPDHASLPPIDLLQNLPEPLQPPTEPVMIHDADTSDSVLEQPSPRPTRASNKARVGFSDTLEYIPRPLSLVSSDTSSTVTARWGHSVSGSISSIVSAASPNGRESPAPLTRSPTREVKESRPSTAGAILERTSTLDIPVVPNASPRRRNSTTALVDVSDAVAAVSTSPSSPIKSSKRWTFFGLENFASSASPIKTRPTSSSSTESANKITSTGSHSDNGSDSSTEMAERDGPCDKKSKKRNKRKNKVKGWAGSILPLKAKGQKKQSKVGPARPPTPPASIAPPEEDDDDGDFVYDEDQASPATPTVTVTAAEPTNTDEPLSPKKPADDVSYPMIDLDAALGPFNTPLPHNPEWEAAQQAAGGAGKRRLHSAQGLRGFNGPGMHYHRRAESAPDLPPFDSGRSAISRFGSSSTMADVFEEEEEEGEGDNDGLKSDEAEESDGETTPSASQEIPVLSVMPDNSNHSVRRRSSGLSDKDQVGAQTVRAECSRTSLQEEVIVEEPGMAIFRGPGAFETRRESGDSVAQSLRKPSSTKELSPVEVGSPNLSTTGFIPTSPYSMSLGSSSYPSPRSPMSIDAQRISTAPSSVADEHSFQSLLMGEPGPEVRISVDYDVPSLTSSRSTMTRESAFIPNPRMSQPSLREQRPVSVSSSAFGRRRSSLVSLSRLISSSHGERSKLSMEVSMDNEPEHKRSRDSKKKRLGRMMQFWKPNKDGSTT